MNLKILILTITCLTAVSLNPMPTLVYDEMKINYALMEVQAHQLHTSSDSFGQPLTPEVHKALTRSAIGAATRHVNLMDQYFRISENLEGTDQEPSHEEIKWMIKKRKSYAKSIGVLKSDLAKLGS